MRTASVAPGAMAVSLAALLISCSATRSSASGPMSPRDLAKYAIVFEPQQDGQVTHTWVPLKGFDIAKFEQRLSRMNIRPNIVRVSSSGLNEYCDGRHDQCVNDCLNSSRPFVIGGRKYMDTQAQPWRIARSWWCPSNCMEELVRCKKGRGVAFAVIVAGSGGAALALVPLLVIADVSVEMPSENQLVEACR